LNVEKATAALDDQAKDLLKKVKLYRNVVDYLAVAQVFFAL
jgi:hypothetical protein